MLRTRVLITFAFAFSLYASAQETGHKPHLSKHPLTAEQIAIYRTVLKDYVKASDDPSLNIANITEPLDLAELKSGLGCLRGIQLEKSSRNQHVIHLLDSAVALTPKMILVDPQEQSKKVEENDPSRLMHRAIDEGEEVSDKQIDESVNQAFRTGLFTLSEIIFDKQHRYAVLSYSFSCGMLCGHGNTIVVRKIGKQWKVTRRTCSGWVS